MAYNANNYQNNTHNGNIQYGNNSGSIPNGMPPPPFVTPFSQASTFGASWSGHGNMHNGYGHREANPIQPYSYSQQQQHLGSRSPANRSASMTSMTNQMISKARPVNAQNPSHLQFRLASASLGNSIGGGNASNGAGYGTPFLPTAHRNPRPNYQGPPNLFGGGAPGPGSFQLPPAQSNDNPPWGAFDKSKHQNQQRKILNNQGNTKIYGKATPASPKPMVVNAAAGTGPIKINGCGDRSMLSLLQTSLEKASGVEEKRDDIGKGVEIAANTASAATQLLSSNALDKTAWRLQAPGMQLFAGKNPGKNGNTSPAAARQGKAERKNTNLEPKAWLYAWLGFRHIRPTYTHETIGQRPDQHFKCSLNAEGFDKVAQGVAQSKKEAQTEAAWSFIDWLAETEKLMSQEIEHVQAMKKKAKGITNSVRDLGKAPITDKEVNVADEEQIRTQMEDVRNKMKVVKIEPPWVRGEQKVNTMDEFWRHKDKMSENCPGGPAVTTTGGAGAPIVQTAAVVSTVSSSAVPDETASTAQPASTTITARTIITPSAIQSETGATEEQMMVQPCTTTSSSTGTDTTVTSQTGKNSMSVIVNSTTPTSITPSTTILPPPVIISNTSSSMVAGTVVAGTTAAVGTGGTEAVTVPQQQQHRIAPPYQAGAQPGSPFPLQHAHHQIPINYMIPPPPFLPPDMYGMPPPPIPPSMPFYEPTSYDNTINNQMPQSQTADNIRDMLDDITKELEEEGTLGNWTPRRNQTLEAQDLIILEHCKDISMNSDQYKVLQKMMQIAESSLKSLSDALVREAAVDNNRTDLVEMIDDAKNNNKVRILQRKEAEVSDEQKRLKEELNRLRIIRSVFRVGHFAMGTLLTDKMMSELVLFTQSVPTRSLLNKIMKLLPSCIDKSLNLGVAEEDGTILISGELLNECVACRIYLTSRKINGDEITVTPDNGLPLEKMQLGLQLVRRVNFWKDVCVNISPIMDQMARMFFRLQNNEGHALQKLTEWQLLLIIYFAIGGCDSSMLGPVDAIRRVCEVIISGAPFCGLRDPVESEPTDFLTSIDEQVFEDISLWAGKTLRLAAFDSIEQVFPITDKNNNDLPDTSDSAGDDDEEAEESNPPGDEPCNPTPPITDSTDPTDENTPTE